MKTLFFNGKIYTGELPLAEAFIIEDGKFLFAGSNEEAFELLSPEDERKDLCRRFVCAGFNDSHMHMLSYGYALNLAPLSEHTYSLEDMLKCLKEHMGKGKGVTGQWVVGRGWNQDYFTDTHRMPTRWDLDKVSRDIPVCAVRACGHALAVNSRAIELIGADRLASSPEGGEILRENGELNGIFFDSAMDIVYNAIPAPDDSDLENMLLSACKELNARGVTSCQSDDYCVFSSIGFERINSVFRKLERENRLTVRVYEQCNFSRIDRLREFIEAGNVTGKAWGESFKIGPLKLLGDGSLGSRTAYLSRPYADAPSTRGLSIFTQEEFDELIGYAHEKGMQIAVHTIGDACVDRVLSAYDKAFARLPESNRRHGLVHCQITRGDQLEKIARMKLHIYAQSIFLDYDIKIVGDRVGEELAASSYSWKTLLKNGATVSNGTDCPVEAPDALKGIQCAVTRMSLDGQYGPYLPSESFSVQEAVDSYTKSGAYASFEENIKGQIAPGMFADFVILERSPFEEPANSIGSIPIRAVYLNGGAVFGNL